MKNILHLAGSRKPAEAGSTCVYVCGTNHPDESGCCSHGLMIDLKYSTGTIVKYDVEIRHCFVFTIMPGFGNKYDPLFSGSLLYSGNARPIPKVAVSSDYLPVPFSQGLIELKGYLAYGWYVV